MSNNNGLKERGKNLEAVFFKEKEVELISAINDQKSALLTENLG